MTSSSAQLPWQLARWWNTHSTGHIQLCSISIQCSLPCIVRLILYSFWYMEVLVLGRISPCCEMPVDISSGLWLTYLQKLQNKKQIIKISSVHSSVYERFSANDVIILVFKPSRSSKGIHLEKLRILLEPCCSSSYFVHPYYPLISNDWAKKYPI